MLSPGFQSVETLTLPLKSLLQRFTDLMKEFGQFCESVRAHKSIHVYDPDWPVQSLLRSQGAQV